MKATKFLIIMMAIVAVSCFDESGSDIVWGDDAYLEIDRAGQPNPNVTVSFARLNDGTTYPFSVQINLMGRPQKKDVTVNFAIDATSTAIEGVHYTKTTPGTSLVIPAGENTATIDFVHLADNIPADAAGAGDDLLIKLSLTGGDLPLSRYVTVTYKLTVTCPSALAGTYDAETDWIDYYGDPGSNSWEETLTAVAGTTRYDITDLSGGMEPIVWGNPAVAARIADICGTISLFSHGYFYPYFIDSGSVNGGTDVITINWRNVYDEAGTTVLTPQ